MQQVKPAKFGEGEEESLRLNWDKAKVYMDDHGLTQVFVDKAQEEYVTELGLGTATFDLSQQYSEWSATATVVLASKNDQTLADITKKMGYGQRAIFQLNKTKAPDENDMYQHQGVAWVVGTQAIIRLYRRCLEADRTPKGLQHKQDITIQDRGMAESYVETKAVIDTRLAATVCSTLEHLPNMGIPALNRLQD
eukprot:11331378-Karenia_brevis.AAC.1